MNMQSLRRCAGIMFAIAGMLPSTGMADEPLAQGTKETIFVGDLKIKQATQDSAQKKGRADELKKVSESLDTQFVSTLSATRVFQLVDRKRLEDLQREQAFAKVAVDPADPKAAQMLKMAGAKYAFFPQIDAFEDVTAAEEFQGIGRSNLQRKVFLSVMVQVVDTTTGKLLPDAPAEQVRYVDTIENAKPGVNLQSDEALVLVAKQMAQRLSLKLVGNIRPGKVLTVTGNQIHVNRGTDIGFCVGLELEFYKTEDVKDEDTGETFRNEVPVAKGRIVRADGRQSFAQIEGDNLGVEKGCIARILSTPAKEAEKGTSVDKDTVSPSKTLAMPPPSPAAKSPATGAVETPGSGEKPLKW